MEKGKPSTKKKFYDVCKQKLMDVKNKHVNALRSLKNELVVEAQGDVADQARALQEETMSLARRGKILQELQEIDYALERIKANTYGVCEETGNVIEDKRLEAIPWTRLSLEGAEIREMDSKEDEELSTAHQQD